MPVLIGRNPHGRCLFNGFNYGRRNMKNLAYIVPAPLVSQFTDNSVKMHDLIVLVIISAVKDMQSVD